MSSSAQADDPVVTAPASVPDGAQRNPGAAVTIAKLIPDFAALHPGYLILQFENVRTFLTLAEKDRIMAALSQFSAPAHQTKSEKNLVGSEGSVCSAEFLEVAPRDELKKPISLV